MSDLMEWSSDCAGTTDEEEVLLSDASVLSIGRTDSLLDLDPETSPWQEVQSDSDLAKRTFIKGSQSFADDAPDGQAEFEALTDQSDSISIQSSSSSVRSIRQSQSSRSIILQKIELFVLDIIRQLCRNGSRDFRQDADLPPERKTVPLIALLKDRSTPKPDKYRRLIFPKNSRYPESANGAQGLAQLLRVLELSHGAILRNIIMTKRDVFYNDVNLFRSQNVVDRLVDDLAATFDVTRGQLHFTGSPKGLFQGDLELVTVNNIIISGKGPPVLIPPSDTIKEIRPGPELGFILIVEKEAVFNSLVDINFANDPRLGPSILICGIGYPNLSTRQLAYRLSEHKEISRRNVPIHILVDCDPHGLDIAKVYKLGSQSMAFHPGLCATRAEYLGVKSSDWEEFNVDLELLCTMSAHDQDKATQLLKLEILPESWKNELRMMKESGKKSEIQILSSAKTRPPMIPTPAEPTTYNDTGLCSYLLKKLGCKSSTRSEEK